MSDGVFLFFDFFKAQMQEAKRRLYEEAICIYAQSFTSVGLAGMGQIGDKLQ